MGSLYTENFPGDSQLPPGSVDILTVLKSHTQCDFVDGVARLPNGHYLFSCNADGIIEVDADLKLVGTATATTIQRGRHLVWDRSAAADSRVWVGGGAGINSFDWRSLTFDPAFALDSPHGFKFLDAEIRSTTYGGGVIAQIEGQDVWVSAGSAPNDPFNFHSLGLVSDGAGSRQLQHPCRHQQTWCEPWR